MAPSPDPTPEAPWARAIGPRRARIALMGEFSAGKSTLANLMIGTDPLPMQVVATRLPPVWISHGNAATVIVDLEGNQSPCNLEAMRTVDPEEVAFIRFQCDEPLLEHCDIIDMPGLSDPNMSSRVWERILPCADGILWCSPATQAWRQSEAAVWEGIEERIRRHSMLLLTRADMLLTDRDRARVLRRVETETDGQFNRVQLISLLQAREAGDDELLWQTCGASSFVDDFMEMLARINAQLSGAETGRPSASDTTVDRGSTGSGQRTGGPHGQAARASLDISDFTPKFS